MVISSLHVVGAGLAQVGRIRGSREKKGVTCNHTYRTYCDRLRGGRDDMEKQAEGEKGLMLALEFAPLIHPGIPGNRGNMAG